MRIERATLAHCREIAEVHVLSWRQAYAGLIAADYLAALSVDGREAAWREVVAKGAPQLLVAVADGRVAGFVAFGPSRDKGAAPGTAEIWALYLAPSCWSQGTGRALWLAALERMREAACSAVSLWVLAGNERARRFYAAAGFAPDLASEREFAIGGARVAELRYVRELRGQGFVAVVSTAGIDTS